METPCAGCAFEPPASGAGNELFDLVYDQAFGCREALDQYTTTLNWDALFRMMDLEGLGAEAQKEIFRKARKVEELFLERQRERAKEAMKKQANK